MLGFRNNRNFRKYVYYKVKNVYVPFSVQLLIDCDTYDSGCNGGLMENALTWLIQNGIMKENDYPYTGKKGICRKDPSKYIDMKVIGYKKLGNLLQNLVPSR